MYVFSYFLMTLLMLSGLFLIGLILLQRGRGGGLAGAFGGMGGQSAFGTKAGDVFTRITIGVASAWILLCAGSVLALRNSGTRIDASVVREEVSGASTKKADPLDAAGKDNDFIDIPKPGADKPAVSEEPATKAEGVKADQPESGDKTVSPAPDVKKDENPVEEAPKDAPKVEAPAANVEPAKEPPAAAPEVKEPEKKIEAGEKAVEPKPDVPVEKKP